MAQDPSSPSGLTYKEAGVNIDAGNSLVERIKPHAARTHRSGVLGSLGGFGGLFELPWDRYRQPVLVSGTDGVGTKLKLAIETGRHEGIGIDLVAMCANDVLVTGAEPLFFLDYYATAKLDVEVAATVVKSIADGCEQAGAALIGGETAEMPDLYGKGDYDLAGFCVGVVEKDQLVDGRTIRPGDVLIGLASSGPHANGYSLIRKLLHVTGVTLDTRVEGSSLADLLLAPTRIYVKSVLQLMAQIPLKGMAHITGGGLTENLPRVLPKGTHAVIEMGSWRRPPVFRWLQERGGIDEREMLRTFNCGVGMVLCLGSDYADEAVRLLNGAGDSAWRLGEIVATEETEPAVAFRYEK